MARLRRTTLSLCLMMLGYGTYALCVVPLVEPKPTEAVIAAEEVLEQPKSSVTDQFVREIAPLFPEGSWELEQPRVLRSNQVTFLMREVEDMEDGRLRVWPCTVIHYDSEDHQGLEGTTILQAPEGAILKFDKPVRFASADFSAKPVSGQLVGSIRIVRQGKTREEDFVLNTSNVHITETTIWTPDDVKFELGSVSGEGSNLEIRRAKSSADARSEFSDAIGTIRLSRVDQLSFPTKGNDLFDAMSPGSDAPTQSLNAKRSAEASTLFIRCQGDMIVDLHEMKATLEEQVVVSRQVEGAREPDTLRADRLWIEFARNTDDKSAELASPGSQTSQVDTQTPQVAAAEAPARKKPSLAITRLVSDGEPLIIHAPSVDATLASQRLEYNFIGKQLKLYGGNPFAANKEQKPVRLRTRQYGIDAPAITFINHEDRTQWQLHIEGAGQFNGVIDGEEQLQATWSTGLHMVPQRGLQVLLIQGNATAELPVAGGIQGHEIELWLQPETKQVGTHMDGRRIYKQTAQPKYLVARGQAGKPIRIDTPRFYGDLQGLEIRFEAGVGPARSNAANLPTASNQRSFGTFPGADSSNKQEITSRFQVQGGSLVAWVDPVSEALRKLSIRGGAKILEEPLRVGAGEQDLLRLEGESIDATLDGDAIIAQLVGSPAQVGSTDLSIQGGQIDLDAKQNQVEIHGAGEINVMVSEQFLGNNVPTSRGDQNLAARPAVAAQPSPEVLKPMKIRWQDGLRFDGQVATLSGEIRASGEDLSFASHYMRVTLDRKILFADLEKKTAQPQLRFVEARGGASCAFRSRDESGRPQSFQQVAVQDFNLDFVTGDLQSRGPGRLSYTSPGKLIPSIDPTAVATDKTTQATDQARVLTLLSIGFNEGMKGNLHRREIHLFDQIRMWTGPVESWEAAIDPNQRQTLRKQDIWISCDELFVIESPTANPALERKPIELLARGDAYVEGQLFAAKGHQITYAEEKDKLTFEGEGDGFATFWQRSAPDAEGIVTANTRRIVFWPKQGRVKTEGTQNIDVSSAAELNQK